MDAAEATESRSGDGRRSAASPRDRSRRTRALFAAYEQTGERRYRNDIVELHLDVADYFARRYGRRGVAAEDLRQIALLAMVRCVDRYDPQRQVEFSTFASRTIDGELKRHFRDKTWAVRPPRALQELHLQVRVGEEELTQLLGRAPTVHELARHLGQSVDSVLAAYEVSQTYYAASLEAPTNQSDDSDSVLGDVATAWLDGGFDQVDVRDAIARVVADLDERDRMILQMRFFENRTQEEVAAAVGVSQSYLSRILRRILGELRQELESHDARLVAVA